MAGRSKSSNKKHGSQLGCLLWLIAFCVVFVLFFAYWGKIKATFDETGFGTLVQKDKRTDEKPPVAPVTVEDEPGAKPDPSPAPEPKTDATPGPEAKPAEPEAKPAEPTVETPKPATPTATQPEAKPATSKPTTPTQTPEPAKTRSAVLYFVKIDDDGVISRQQVKRVVPSGDSPLMDSLAALLKGPNDEELRKGLITLIPQGTKLLSARVADGTAYLNFNEAFMYNKYGIEGYAGQLKQVVYSSTEFATVRYVQVLIEGRTVDYLGGEGVYIGKPLSRASF